MRKIISSILLLTISSQLLSCGYVIHPERRGQTSGKVDLAIVGLDAIGLIFFILPGLIAFGVDIVSGTIYLPKDSKGFSLSLNDAEKIHIDPKNMNKKTIIAAIKEKTGITVDMNDPQLMIVAKDTAKLTQLN